MNNQTNRTRRVASKKLHGIFAKLADEICRAQERVTLAMNGNTFEIHLEGGTINITLNEEGGAR